VSLTHRVSEIGAAVRGRDSHRQQNIDGRWRQRDRPERTTQRAALPLDDRWEDSVSTYRFFLVDRLGETTATETREFKDDLDALDEARKLADGCEVELWLGPMRIAHVKAGDAAHTARDRISG
jgi:hypothetical protein